MRVAFLCFTPDWGHIQPLVRMARAAHEAGWSVRCYLPRETVDRIGVTDIEMVGLELSGAPLRRCLSRLASRSLFFTNYTGYCHLNLLVYPELIRAASDVVEGVAADLQAFAPMVTVADSYLFSETYARLAAYSRSVYVEHSASGAATYLHRPYVRVYGLMDGMSPAMASFIERLGALHTLAYRLAFYALHLHRWLVMRDAKKAMAAAIARLRPPSSAPRLGLTTGLSWVEKTLLPSADDHEQGLGDDLPPLPPVLAELPEDLAAFIDGATGPVVYVSFGSMLTLSGEQMSQIAAALGRLGCWAIWTVPSEGLNRAEAILAGPRCWVSSYVPQATLLQHKSIACFITHAGAGGVVEALTGGTPMLCVPLFGDAGFLSGLASRLGVGRRVWKSRLGSPVFEDTLREIVWSAAYSECAQAVAHQIAAAKSETRFIDFLQRAADLRPILT